MSGAAGLTEIVAFYGGAELGLSVFALSSSTLASLHLTSSVLLGCGALRLGSWLVHARRSQSQDISVTISGSKIPLHLLVAAAELGGAAVGLWAWRAERALDALRNRKQRPVPCGLTGHMQSVCHRQLCTASAQSVRSNCEGTAQCLRSDCTVALAGVYRQRPVTGQ